MIRAPVGHSKIATTRYYTCRDRLLKLTHPDSNSLDYTYDDHLRLTAENLDGDTEKYEYEYCLCGPVKRHKYTYTDSLDNSQTLEWANTVDKLGRRTKEYYPYTIAVDGSDNYRSILYEYDRASRREWVSDPTFGHKCADTSGWPDQTEPEDEDDWVDIEPQRYMYGMTGGVEAVGRVAGARIMAGEGEPYFVRRDRTGRIERVIYPNASGKDKPQIEQRYDYAADGRLARVAVVDQTSSDGSTYGPEKYVVEYAYDEMGRLRKKTIRDNTVEDSAVQAETDYEYDGLGQLIRERLLQWDDDEERMLVTQEIHTKYDLGRNPTEIKYHDAFGWALTETRTYARGYQLTGFSTSARADITVDTSGSYTYDTNNNMLTTKSLDIYFMTAGSGNVRLVYRAEWTFTFNRKNRLKSFTNEGANDVRTNLWYDAMGRVWQRWNDDSQSEEWAETLMRYVYDGNALAQEHEFSASGNGMWIYNYVRYDRDYLHKPDGVRQRSYVGPSSYTDEFLFRDMGDIASKVTRGSSATVTRAPRMASGERTPENDLAPTTSSFTDISRLGAMGAFTESYGGGTTNPRTQGFDALQQSGGRHYLPAIGQGLSAPASSGSRRTIARPSDTSPQQDIVPGDITGPDDPALAEFYKELRYYSWLPNSELACSCDEACENGAECENITHCWQRQCFVTVIPEEPVIDPDTDIECGIHCPAVGVCPEVNCDYWTASLWCCPCNDCPPVGTPITINGKQHEVIQTDLCPDDYAIARMGICDDETLDCVAGIWPFEIPGSIPDAVIELLRRLGEENLWNPNCPNVIFTLTGAHAFSFHGHSGNIFFIERCLQCHCAAVRTGLYGENSPCD